jgi:phosphoribosylpyrophosphate synthetase
MREKSYKPIGRDSATYGWTGSSPTEFAERMELASARFVKLKEELDIDAIAFCGSSGCAIAFNLAAKHKIPLMYVRKKDEKSHSTSRVECNDKKVEVKKYLIVDDFVDRGRTVDYITENITKYAKQAGAYPAESVGVLCFDRYVSSDHFMQTNAVSLKIFSASLPPKPKRKKATVQGNHILIEFI